MIFLKYTRMMKKLLYFKKSKIVKKYYGKGAKNGI